MQHFSEAEQTKGERATVVPPGADGFKSQSRQVRLLLAHGAKPGIERRAEMDTETMIRELESVEEKHKSDVVYTGQLNIAEMAHDCC